MTGDPRDVARTEQLGLPLKDEPERIGLGPARVSWWDVDHPEVRELGAMSLDLTWPWLNQLPAPVNERAHTP